MYRTGDRGRLLPDGSYDFVGRTDDQVKVRGARVELREVEAALCRQPGVSGAAVVVVNSGLEARLVGFVSGGAAKLSAAEIQRGLGRWLPRHMLPSAVHVIDDIPLTPSGKVDRSLLEAKLTGINVAP
jgi:acyl-coenzyme A synthetase/AMP-(fatty) acid ligase